jgi:hypothetical protein
MRPIWMSTVCTSALAALSLACGGDGGTTPGGGAAALHVVSGDQQTAPPNAELPQPLVVRVTDGAGQPVEGQIVNFRVVSGGGSMFAGAGITDAQGIVQDRWTLGPTEGPQAAEARAVDNTTGAPIVFATFTAMAGNPGGHATLGSMSIVGEWSGIFTVGTHVPPIAFLVKDAAGAPLPNYQFTLRAMTGVTSNGQFCVSSPDDEQLATLTTGPDGTATFTGWTLGTQRGDTCLGVFPGTTQPQNTSDIGVWHFWVRLVPGAPAQLVKLDQDNQQAAAGTVRRYRIRVEDQYGNTIGCGYSSTVCVDPDAPEVPVTFVASGGEVSPAQSMTERGSAYTDWTLAPGVNTLTISVGSLSVTYTVTGN